MGQTPYTYIQCPCSEVERADDSPVDQADDELTFDPRAPRSNFSLYPLEYLLYCEDCQQIRCPRCVNEETATYFCPNCLFEVPSSNLRSEGNRYVRLWSVFVTFAHNSGAPEAAINAPSALAPSKSARSSHPQTPSRSPPTATQTPPAVRLPCSASTAIGPPARLASSLTGRAASTPSCPR